MNVREMAEIFCSYIWIYIRELFYTYSMKRINNISVEQTSQMQQIIDLINLFTFEKNDFIKSNVTTFRYIQNCHIIQTSCQLRMRHLTAVEWDAVIITK